MKFTIGTISNFSDLSESIKLIKSSLLYADEIEMLGITEYAVHKYLPSLLDSSKGFEPMLDKLIPFLESANIPNKEDLLYKLTDARNKLSMLSPNLNRNRHKNKKEMLLQIRLNQMRHEIQPQLDIALRQLLDHPYSAEIDELIKSKHITIFDYHLEKVGNDDLAGGYIGGLLSTLYSENTFPLFDNQSKDIISAFVKTKLVDLRNLSPEYLRHAGVASSILITLPTLESASIDELVSLKEENQIPLSRFRSAVYGYSEKIGSLPWDDDFQFECLKLYNTEVVPAITEINEILTDTSILKNLGKKVLSDEEFRKAAGWSVGGLTAAITSSSGFAGVIPQIFGLASWAALSGAAAKSLIKAAELYIKARDETAEAKKAAKSNVMYYYHLASNL